jgi:hypothetical protein
MVSALLIGNWKLNKSQIGDYEVENRKQEVNIQAQESLN